MKINAFPYLIASVVGLILTSAAPHIQSPAPALALSDQNLIFPDDVMAIIDSKCMGCHNQDARNEKAKEKLQWSQLASMETEDLISKLDVLLEVLEAGDMPPAKMLEKYPDKKLTQEETTLLTKWASDNIDRLIGE